MDSYFYDISLSQLDNNVHIIFSLLDLSFFTNELVCKSF